MAIFKVKRCSKNIKINQPAAAASKETAVSERKLREAAGPLDEKAAQALDEIDVSGLQCKAIGKTIPDGDQVFVLRLFEPLVALLKPSVDEGQRSGWY